ncbi:MAG: L-lactate dehydrogenase [Oscillospiraceae bacterium]|nr:L-lactate dehydrogenase [Oscillospiraceae bacterium]
MLKGKVAVIGAGFVGSTIAYTLMLSGLVSEIVLLDINGDKADGDALDMNHGMSFISPVKITGGDDYSNIKGSDMLIITAGVGQRPGENRIDLLKRNVAVFEDILNKSLKYCDSNTIIMVVTNPVDILTYVAQKVSGFPKNTVIGSGTVLDTARLKYLIGEYTGIDPRNVHSYIIGEHGDTEVAAWSMTTIAGISLEDYCGICKLCGDEKAGGIRICKDEFYVKTRDAAYHIIEKKGATYYAIALSVRRIVESIIGNENSILTVSSLLEGEYGIRDICLSVPTVVNSRGADGILELPFSEDECKALTASADTLSKLAREIGY